jgi:hypothetical protein
VTRNVLICMTVSRVKSGGYDIPVKEGGDTECIHNSGAKTSWKTSI